jgi:hypothetical protein
MGQSEEVHWVCQACKLPLAEKGIIEVINININLGEIGGYPVSATEDESVVAARERRERALAEGVDPGEEIGFKHIGGVDLEPLPRNVGFAAKHVECYADTENFGYHFPSGDVPILDEWIKKVLHLSEKTWMGREDLIGMIEFWWSHKGDNPFGNG